MANLRLEVRSHMFRLLTQSLTQVGIAASVMEATTHPLISPFCKRFDELFAQSRRLTIIPSCNGKYLLRHGVHVPDCAFALVN
jgi:hypothetical protein